MALSSFSLLHDRALSSPVALAAWCPTMDLLATVSQDNQLTVRRLDWQTLWVACPNAAITALCWKPDGKEVVTGHVDGSIRHFSVERCELVHEAASTTGPHAGSAISHLSWVEADARMQSMPMLQQLQHRHVRLFSMPLLASDPAPKPPTAADLDLAAPTLGGQGRACPWPTPPESLHVLTSCDAKGVVCVWAYGQLLLGRLQASGDCGYKSHVAMQAHLSRDLCTLMVLVQPDEDTDQSTLPHLQSQEGAAGAGDGAGVGASSGVLQAVAYSTEVLQHPHVQQLAILAVHLRQVVAAALHGVSSAHKEWAAAQQELRKRLGQLAQNLRDHAELAAPGQAPEWQEDEELVEGELLCMLASGCATPGMHAFLTSTLGEHGLRRLAKTMDSAVQSVHALVLDQVQPATEVALFLLGEVKGLALAGAGSLGLQAEQVCHAELEAAKAALQCEALRLAVTTVGCQLRSLFNWLHRTWYQLEGLGKDANAQQPGTTVSGQVTSFNIQDIMALLSGHLAKDTIQPDLQDAPVFMAAGEEDSTASLAFSKSPLLDEAKQAMEAMYKPLIPADIASCTPSSRSSTWDPKPSAQPAATSPGSIQTWPSKPLNAQLKLLSTLCEHVLAGVSAALSPALAPVLQVPLAPLHSATGPLACRCHMAQLKSDPCNGSIRVCVAVPRDAGAVGAGADTDGDCDGSGDLLLVVELGEAVRQRSQQHATQRVTQPPPQAPGQTEESRLRVCLLQSPPELSLEDLGFYRDAQLGLLLATAGTSNGTTGSSEKDECMDTGSGTHGGVGVGTSRLALVPPEAMEVFCVEALSGNATSSVLQVCRDQDRVLPLSIDLLRGRGCPQGSFEAPLALSGPRGVAALFSDGLRAYLLDVEEDEGGDGEEEAEEADAGEDDMDS